MISFTVANSKSNFPNEFGKTKRCELHLRVTATLDCSCMWEDYVDFKNDVRLKIIVLYIIKTQ